MELDQKHIHTQYHHNVCTVKQTFVRITTYPHGTNVFKVCKSEMLKVCEAKATLKMISKECGSEMYVKEKERCEIFLKYVNAKCKTEMRKYVRKC